MKIENVFIVVDFITQFHSNILCQASNVREICFVILSNFLFKNGKLNIGGR